MRSRFEQCVATLPEHVRQSIARIESADTEGPRFSDAEIADARAVLAERTPAASDVQGAFDFNLPRGAASMK